MRSARWLVACILLASISACSDSGTDTAQIRTDGSNPNAAPEPDDQVSNKAADHARKHAHDGNATGAHDHASHAKATQQHSGHSHGGHAAVKRTSGLKIGEVVPDFEVTLDGKVCKLSELQANKELTADGTLALTFWCSFCHSCRDVEADLDKLAAELKGKAGVVAIDASVGETQEEIDEVKESKGLTLPIAINADASVADLFGIKVTTTTVVIDAERKLRYCGQFADRGHRYAADALASVMSGTDVAIPESAHRG